MDDLSFLDDKLIIKIICEELPKYVEKHPEAIEFLKKILQEKSLKKAETKNKFDKDPNELKDNKYSL